RSMTGPCSTLHGRKQERGRTRPHQELWMLCWRSLQTARTVQLEGSLKRAPTAARVGDGPTAKELLSTLCGEVNSSAQPVGAGDACTTFRNDGSRSRS